MKNFAIISAVLFLLTSSAKSFGITNNQAALQPLLSLYYDVKNALVSSDAEKAANKAGAFVKAMNEMDKKTLTAAELKTYTALEAKLTADAKKIAESKSIEKQRATFASLSANFYTLAKAVKLSNEPVYQQYCPMKKSYWLSHEADIKNPYYGKSMLDCGEVTDTIK